MTTIGAYAFAGTNYRPMSLETVTMGQNSNLFTIGEGAFYNCALLTSFYLPVNITAIEWYTFYNTAEMSQFTLHSGSRLYSIGEYAFYNSGITGLNVPADIETIGRSAFENSDISFLHDCRSAGRLPPDIDRRQGVRGLRKPHFLLCARLDHG